MKKVFLVALLATMTLAINAQKQAKVPAYRGVIERVQPNGDTLRTYLRGDERMHWTMTLGGWQITQNDQGWYVYMQAKGENAAPSRKKAHNAADRSKCEKKWLEKHGVKRS